jgi:RNA polymerase sigma-70 factor (ECF subfamily)
MIASSLVTDIATRSHVAPDDRSPTSPRVASPDRTRDQRLVEQLRRGSESAFEEVVVQTSARFFAVARRLLGCEAEASDALQEAYLAAFRSIHQFRGESSLASWLRRIVINACYMRLRERARRDERSLDDLLPTYSPPGPPGHHGRDGAPAGRWNASADELLQYDEVRAKVRQCVDRLPAAARAILILRDVEGLDTEETARIIGIRRGAVKTRLHRARLALRSMLERELT